MGDVVSEKGGFSTFLGHFGVQGRVCRIEDDIIWIMVGNCPEELIMSGTLDWQPKNNIIYKGIKYHWIITNKHKDNLKLGNLLYFQDFQQEENI